MHAVYCTFFTIVIYTWLTHIHQGCFIGAGAVVWLPQCQWSNPESMAKIDRCRKKRGIRNKRDPGARCSPLLFLQRCGGRVTRELKWPFRNKSDRHRKSVCGGERESGKKRDRETESLCPCVYQQNIAWFNKYLTRERVCLCLWLCHRTWPPRELTMWRFMIRTPELLKLRANLILTSGESKSNSVFDWNWIKVNNFIFIWKWLNVLVASRLLCILCCH